MNEGDEGQEELIGKCQISILGRDTQWSIMLMTSQTDIVQSWTQV